MSFSIKKSRILTLDLLLKSLTDGESMSLSILVPGYCPENMLVTQALWIFFVGKFTHKFQTYSIHPYDNLEFSSEFVET